ncbi:S22555Ig heavy chain V region (family VI) -African clawed frog [Pelobates cultripes]|uniref:S22555Ig heavy chain V region (Family VI) -African clawed frog n=1 Tax=Pelobates cultripes TaxID=61616 RepID=A0AAD1W5L3_PELCU|nr:S22555Ig heavy chain V region (family VI) -African clawed frog [Pelobates cultripes]
MRSFCIVLLLLISGSSVLSQAVTLDQPESTVVKPSEGLKLPCKVSVAVTSYHWYWIRQLPGKGLEYIGRISSAGGSEPASSFSSRATFTRDTAKNEIYVQITNMRNEESGTYYCTSTMRQGNNRLMTKPLIKEEIRGCFIAQNSVVLKKGNTKQ